MAAKNILAVDTSSRVLSVAIRTTDKATFEANLEGTPRHSERLIGVIEEGLRHVGLKKMNSTNLFGDWGPVPSQA